MAHPGERGITAPEQEGFSRRDFLHRTVVAGAVTASGLLLPQAVFGTERPIRPDNLVLPMNAEQRLAELRTSERNLIPATAEPYEISGRTSFGPGDRVDRGNPDEKVFYLRADDFWWQDAGHAYLDVIEEEKIPVILAPVEEAVRAFPDIITRGYSLKDGSGKRLKRLIAWANHTKGHEALDQKSIDDVMHALLPQTHALEDVLLREERSLFIAPPYGAGAMPGYEETDPQITEASRRLQSAILGWTLDTRSWDGASEDQIVDTVLSKIVKGAIVVTHPVPDGSEARALRRWVRILRNHGWRAGRLSELYHVKATGH